MTGQLFSPEPEMRPSKTTYSENCPIADTHGQGKSVMPDAVSVLSHELLSPLTLIKGYTATLLQLGDVTTEEQKLHYLRRIESATDRLIRLLGSLRDLTRLESGDAGVVEPDSLPDTVRKIVADMQSQTTKHLLKLHVSKTLPQVKFNRDRIEQVLTNLLTNAIKYSPQGGDIETEIRLVNNDIELKELYGEAPQIKLPGIIVSVADSGIGLPEEELGRIFKRFYRVNNNITRTTPGAGLGLYISRIIVEAHGGQIWARNRFEKGSVFSFSLPLD